MAIRRQNRLYSQQRLAIPQMKAIESGVSADWDSFLRNMWAGTTQPYVINGLTINIGAASFTQTADNLTLNSLNAVILNNTALESGTLLAIPGFSAESLNSTNSRVVGSFVAGATNYVAINYIRQADTSSIDTVYLFDKNSNTEFNKQLPISTILDYQIVINTTGFGINDPIATVVTNSGNVPTTITDSRYLMFRLGTGGAAPNPFYSYPWSSGRTEPPISSVNSAQNPFTGGDKQLLTMKDWMNAVMTSFKEIKGSSYWYAATSGGSSTGLSLLTVNDDANLSFFTGTGTIGHDSVTLGKIVSSSDVFIRNIVTDAYFHLQAFNKTLNNGDACYVSLVRYTDITGSVTITPATIPSPSALNTASGGNTGLVIQVSSVGQFTGLVATAGGTDGDWVKSKNDSEQYFRQIAQFYDATGAISTAAGATYILLDSAYNIAGASTGSQNIHYNQGYYSAASIQSGPKAAVLATNQLQNVYWIANRVGSLIYVHGSIGELVQGETKNVNDPISQNLLSFVGAGSESANNPTYASTIAGAITTTSQVNYGGTSTDNLTVRTSLLTTAASDQAQNKNISLIGGGNLSNSSGNLIWTSAATIIINGPGVGVTNNIAANNPTGISLTVGTCAYVNIQRETNGATLPVSVTTYANVPLTENTYVIARASPTTSDMIVGIDGMAYLIGAGTTSNSGFNPANAASTGVSNVHKWRQEKPSVNLYPLNSVNVSMTPYSSSGLLLFRDGLVQVQGTDYNISNQAITFTYPLKSTDEVVAIFPIGKVIQYSYAQETPTGTPNGVLTTFGISQSIGNPKCVCLFLNSLQRQYGTDFTVSGQTITFTYPPATGSTLYIFYTTANDTIYADQSLLGTTPNANNQLFTYFEDINEINSVIMSVDGVAQFTVNNVPGPIGWTLNDFRFLDGNGILVNPTGWGGSPPPTNSILYLFGR